MYFFFKILQDDVIDNSFNPVFSRIPYLILFMYADTFEWKFIFNQAFIFKKINTNM
jgi:hypothetical protein